MELQPSENICFQPTQVHFQIVTGKSVLQSYILGFTKLTVNWEEMSNGKLMKAHPY